MRYLFYLFVIYYLYKIVTYFFNYIELKKLVSFFSTTLSDLSEKEGRDIKEKDFIPLIRKKPAVNKFLGYNPFSVDFSYSSDLKSLARSSVDIYHFLLEALNIREYGWKKELSPLHQLKELFSIPAQILMDSGVKLSKLQSLLVNFFTYSIGYLLTLFSSEIKALIVELFQQL